MTIVCPHCSQVNPDQSGFCARCGNRLQSTGQTVTGPSGAGAPVPTYAASGMLSNQMVPTASSPPTGPSYPSSPSLAPQFPSSQLMPPTNVAPPPPTIQMGTGQGLGSLRRAFAGRGVPTMHYSWLLDGEQAQAIAVRFTINETLQRRGVAGLEVKQERLIERGLLMEERGYTTLHRGVTTVFVHVAPAGRDLYISRATAVLPAISSIRVVIATLLLLLMLFGFVQPPIPTILLQSSAAYGGSFTPVTTFQIIASVLSYPILAFFIIMLIRSFIYWLIENDFLVYLRSNVLNDFQMDDIVVLEHLTDHCVQEAPRQIGMDASKITPPIEGYRPKRRLRGSGNGATWSSGLGI